MIKQFEKLKPAEINLLLRAPVLVSLLAAIGDKDISEAKKAEAFRLAHLKTFTAHPLLTSYYKQVEESFKTLFEEARHTYTPFDAQRRKALMNELLALNSLISKLDRQFALILHESLSNYTAHVKRAGRFFIEDFVFPLPIPGLME